MQQQQEKNREASFKILDKASEDLLQKFRLDETNLDLFDQFRFRPENDGSGRYYLEPYRSVWGSLIESVGFTPFPQQILQQYSKIECASFMGILPEINRVWVTVDNKLFLWNYCNPDDFDVYDGVKEVIVSVALSAPKPGIFLDSVKYVLVIATPVEIVLLALSVSKGTRGIRMIPTVFSMPSDYVTMLKVIGSQSGRVFMAGNDGNIYELDYFSEDNSITTLLSGGQSRKCRKINHFAWNWKLVHLVPPFLKSFVGGEDSLSDLEVDNVRNVLYAITTHGCLSVFNLGYNCKEMFFAVTSFDLIKEAKTHLQNNRNLHESSPKPDTFNNTSSPGFQVISITAIPVSESKKIHLMAVLANGIRIYLSLLTSNRSLFTTIPNKRNHTNTSGPCGIEIAYVRSPPSPGTLQSCNPNSVIAPAGGNNAGDDVQNGSIPSFSPFQSLKFGAIEYNHGVVLMSLDQQQQPDEIVAVFEDLVCRARLSMGQAPSYQPPSMREGLSIVMDSAKSSGKIHDIRENSASIHCAGLTQMRALYAQSSTPSSNSLISNSSHHFYKPPPAPKPPTPNAVMFPVLNKVVTNIKMVTDKVIGVPPPPAKPAAAPSALTFGIGNTSTPSFPSDTPALYSDSLVTPTTTVHTNGLDQNDLDQVVTLGEMAWQHMPYSGADVPTRREWLALTNHGLHVFNKLRPADILYRLLTQLSANAEELLRHFFVNFGPLQSSAMCVALACGLPNDAGGSSSFSCLSFEEETGESAKKAGNTSMPLRMASGSIPIEAIQSRAMNVMLSITEGPTFRPLIGNSAISTTNTTPSTANAITGGSFIRDSGVVLSGGGGSTHEFIKSSAHDALYLVCSRVLRPVWLRPVAVPVFQGSQAAPHHKMKVAPLWNIQLISQIRNPLFQLCNILSGYFPTAVMGDPKKLDFVSSMQVLSPPPQLMGEDSITQQMRDRAHVQPNPVRALQQQAKAVEDSSLLALYRTATRCVQALSLLEILITVEQTWAIPIAWQKLGDISFRALVVSPQVHDSVKSVIMDLIQQLSSRGDGTDASPVADRTMSWLSEECFHYFSAGDRYTYESARIFAGLKKDAESISFRDTQRNSEMHVLASKCVQLLLKAARYWTSLELVCGGGLVDQQCELVARCADLLRLGRVGREGIVDLCLAAARNFSSDDQDRGKKDVFISPPKTNNTPTKQLQEEEKRLYHGGSILSDADRLLAEQSCFLCLIQQILAVGSDIPLLGGGPILSSTERSSEDAKVVAQRNMTDMIRRAVQNCQVKGFHDLLYNELLSQRRGEYLQQLLAIKSPFIVPFLRVKDPTLLYRYHEQHAQHIEAAELMYELAKSTAPDGMAELQIQTRVEYLRLSVASAEKAVSMTKARGSEGHASGLVSGYRGETTRLTVLEFYTEVKDVLDVAEIQLHAYTKLSHDFKIYGFSSNHDNSRFNENERRQLELMEKNVNRLENKLLLISELFHEIAMAYKLWDVALQLLHISHHEDLELIARLWRSFIYRLVPETAGSGEGQAFLRLKRSSDLMDIDKRIQRRNILFEETSRWLPQLQHEITNLGKLIYKNFSQTTTDPSTLSYSYENNPVTSHFAFPATIVLEELEEIAASITICGFNDGLSGEELVFNLGRFWPAQSLVEIGLNRGSLVECYMDLFDRWAGKVPEKLLQLLSATTNILLDWTKGVAMNNGVKAAKTRQLAHAVRAGRVQQWLEKLRRHVSSLLSGRQLLPSTKYWQDLLEKTSNEIVEVDQRVNELILV